MFLARVTGSVVSTVKVKSMVGQKLFTVEPLRVDPESHAALKPVGRTFVAVDLVGVGEGQVVLLVQGSSARMTEETAKLPVDAAIIAIVNQVSAYGNEVFSAREEK
jgi:ethanolamine utilization protein EutN